MTHSLTSLGKLCNEKSSQFGIFTNKLDDSENTTILMSFFSHFHFEKSHHQTHIADKLTNIIAKV